MEIIGKDETPSVGQAAMPKLAEARGEKVELAAVEMAGKYGGTSAVSSSPMSINPPSFVADNGGILFLVEAGFGNSLMPSCIRQLQNDRIRVIDLEDNSFSIDITISYSKKNSPGTLLETEWNIPHT